MPAKVTIDGKEYSIPLGADEITLGQRIDFDAEHGDDLNKRLKKILEGKDETLKALDFGEYHLDLACKSLSFFAKIPISVVHQTSIYEVLEVWKTVLDTVGEDLDFTVQDRPIKYRHEWQDQTWGIYPPEVKQDSKVTFGEFLDGKQVVQNLYQFGTARWQALLPLCCIYLRPLREDGNLEPYTEDLPNEDGPRWKLFRDLPLSIAYEVGFFLSETANIYRLRFPSSARPGLKAAAR